jgi:hypothetical protein
VNRCSGGKDVARNLNLLHAARQWSGSIAPAQSGCFWGSTNAFGQFAGSVAASVFNNDADSLAGLGIDAAVDGEVEASRATSTRCIANIVMVGSICLWMTAGGNKERTRYCELTKKHHELS